jgi:halimadienyl-diphosphate synthase
MSVRDTIRQFLTQVGQNTVTSDAYDTAWLAAVPTADGAPRFPAALDWVRRRQRADGSWGAPWPYYHDRLICTLRAVLTLHYWQQEAADQEQVRRGLAFIRDHADALAHDPWETVGFELIFPTLLAAAAEQGLDLPYQAFAGLERIRAAKLAIAPLDLAYDRRMPLVVDLEGLGSGFDLRRAATTQEAIGAVGMSPAATAFLLLHDPANAPATGYLSWALAGAGDGGVPAYFPLETFERSWGLYQLQHAWPTLHADLPAEVGPALDFLLEHRQPAGWTSSIHATVKEADTTAVVFAVLSRAGYRLDPALLYQYEEATHFRCYPFERNPSISVHAHMLDALHYTERAARAPRIAKVLRFLEAVRQPAGHWLDKWHVSPYYVTTRVVLAAATHGLAPDLAAPAVDWLVRSQRADGGWGYYPPTPDAPTLEETAYALLALFAWRDTGRAVPAAVLAHGAAYLRTHATLPPRHYPPLWIAKALYIPVQVVQAAVLAALLRCEEAGL